MYGKSMNESKNAKIIMVVVVVVERERERASWASETSQAERFRGIREVGEAGADNNHTN